MKKLLVWVLILLVSIGNFLDVAKAAVQSYELEIPAAEETVIGVNHGRNYLEHFGVFWSRNTSERFRPTNYEIDIIGHDDFPKKIPSEDELRDRTLKFLDENPTVEYFEFWNEMNTPWSFPATCPGDPNRSGFVCFKSSAKIYTKLLKVFAETIRSKRPSAKIGLGALADSWPEKYLQYIYDAGGKEFFDIVLFNPEYVKLPDTTRTQKQKFPELAAAPEYKGDIYRRGTRAKIKAVEDMMDRYDDGEKPLWIGETGYSRKGDRAYVDSQDQQIDYQVRSLILSFAEPKVKKYFLYRWGEGGIEGDFELPDEMYRVLYTLTDVFNRYSFVSAEVNDEIYEYHYQAKNGQGKITFLWSPIEKKTLNNVDLPQGKLYSIFGKPLDQGNLGPRPLMIVEEDQLRTLEISDELIWLYDQIGNKKTLESIFGDLQKEIHCSDIEALLRIPNIPSYDYQSYYTYELDQICPAGRVILQFFNKVNYTNYSNYSLANIDKKSLKNIPNEIFRKYRKKWESPITMQEALELFVKRLMLFAEQDPDNQIINNNIENYQKIQYLDAK